MKFEQQQDGDKCQIEIKHKLTGEVLKTVDAENLRGANLRGADLRGADLMLFRFNRHQAIFTPCGTVTIGCERHKLDHWLEHADEIGKKHDYSEVEIRAYKQWIEICREVQQSEGGEHS